MQLGDLEDQEIDFELRLKAGEFYSDRENLQTYFSAVKLNQSLPIFSAYRHHAIDSATFVVTKFMNLEIDNRNGWDSVNSSYVVKESAT